MVFQNLRFHCLAINFSSRRNNSAFLFNLKLASRAFRIDAFNFISNLAVQSIVEIVSDNFVNESASRRIFYNAGGEDFLRESRRVVVRVLNVDNELRWAFPSPAVCRDNGAWPARGELTVQLF